jgi:hypothetical protein
MLTRRLNLPPGAPIRLGILKLEASWNIATNGGVSVRFFSPARLGSWRHGGVCYILRVCIGYRGYLPRRVWPRRVVVVVCEKDPMDRAHCQSIHGSSPVFGEPYESERGCDIKIIDT